MISWKKNDKKYPSKIPDGKNATSAMMTPSNQPTMMAGQVSSG